MKTHRDAVAVEIVVVQDVSFAQSLNESGRTVGLPQDHVAFLEIINEVEWQAFVL